MTPILFRACIPLLATLTLCGCIEDLLPFSQKTNYQMTGVEEQSDLGKYVQSIIDDEVKATPKKSDGDDAETIARRESYLEQTLKTTLVKAMEAKGYYDGSVDYIDDKNATYTGTYNIAPGNAYTISSVDIEPKDFRHLLTNSKVHAGDILDAVAVLTEQQNLQQLAQRHYCYFSLTVKNEVLLNHKDHSGKLTYHVTVSPEGHFGAVSFTGNTNINTSYLNKLVPWKENDCYRSSKVEQFKSNLLESGLLSRAEVTLPNAPADDGTVDLQVVLTERAQRTWRAGLSYYTDEGIGAIVNWQHRNLLGSAENFTATLNLSTLNQSLEAKLTKPFFLRNDQNLSLNTSLQREDTDAYEEIGMDIGANISRKFNKKLSASTGVNFTLTQITEQNNINNDEGVIYGLLSFPNSMTYDSRRNKLDPKQGALITTSITPFVDALGESDPFLKLQAGASTYYAFDKSAQYIIAFRAGLGSIVGSDNLNVPSTERFYAGGGGTVRGFAYQGIGPKDTNGDPIGGSSLATASTELRIKFTDTIGGVVFMDAGSVSEKSYPDMSNIAISAGIGARYYTSFGPLRFDIATPLTQKDDLDQNYQFYISIGQAF